MVALFENQAMSETMLERCIRLVDWEWARHDPKGTVRAIVAAIREPTPEMLEAAYGGLLGGHDGEALRIWRAMMDEAIR
jgi:hypothetical protein